MLKLKKGANEYEILGQITFDNDGVEQTNYTIVINGVTTTIESTDTEWEVIDVPDPIVEPEPEPEPEPTPEPEPEPTPEPEPELTPEEIAQREAEEAFNLAKREWWQKKNALTMMIEDMERGQKLGISPEPEQIAIMESLALWVKDNLKKEYYF